MKNFSSKTRENFRHSSRRPFFFRLFFGVAILITVVWFFGGLIGGLTSLVTSPIYALRTWSVDSVSSISLYFGERGELIQTMEELREKLSAESGRSSVISRLTIENEELRKLVSAYGDARIAAAVIARPPMLPYDAILIDRGTDDGVSEGLPALPLMRARGALAHRKRRVEK